MENRRRHYVSTLLPPSPPPISIPAPHRQALAAIDNYRHCVKDQVEFLRQQNHDLRIRLSKLNEIETRIDGLISRDEQNTHELELLRVSLHQKAAEIEDLKHCVELEKHNAMQNQNMMRTEMQNLVGKIGWMNRDRQEAEVLVEKRFQEVRAITAREVEGARRELKEAQQQAQMHINRLEETIRGLGLEIEQKDRENGAMRLRMMDELQQLATRNDQLTRDNNCLNQQNSHLRSDLESLIIDSKQLKQAHEMLTVDKLRTDQEKAQLLIDIKELERQLGALTRDNRGLEDQLMQRDEEIRGLLEANKQITVSCEDLDDQLRKKNRLLDDYHTELTKEQDTHRIQIADITGKLMDAQDARDRLSIQLSQLTQKSQLLQHQTDAKTVEIRDLLYGIQRLQQKLLSFQAKCRILQNDNTLSAQKISLLGQQKQTGSFEVRSMQQKLLLKESHIQELEDLLEAERTARLVRDKEIQELRRALGNPQQVARKYEEEMLRMVRGFQEEKVKIEDRFNEEKKRLRELYEYELKDTHDLFERKMRVLEERNP